MIRTFHHELSKTHVDIELYFNASFLLHWYSGLKYVSKIHLWYEEMLILL